MRNRNFPESGRRCAHLALAVFAAILLAACEDSDTIDIGPLPPAELPPPPPPPTPVDPIGQTATALFSAPPANSGPSFEIFRGYDLAPLGYVGEEVFASGEARRFVATAELTRDGDWQAGVLDTAEYLTRAVVYKPANPADFNGTVIVEWFNVSGGGDLAPDWIYTHTELIREGYAWVGVSAQNVGINGDSGFALKNFNPDRYGGLIHPGDDYSYDIFSQIANAVTPSASDNLLGAGYLVDIVIASGDSQSANRLTTYVNAIHEDLNIFDGFFLHSYTGNTPSLGPTTNGISGDPPTDSLVRNDASVPVLMFQVEGDLTRFRSDLIRQPDTNAFRLWEAAGAAHSDLYVSFDGLIDTGGIAAFALVVENAAPVPGIVECDFPLNDGPHQFVAKAAMDALRDWIISGAPPPPAPLIETDAMGNVLRDANGNALGGIRTPDVDVPRALLTGVSRSDQGFCPLLGETMLFDDAAMIALYGNKAAYVAMVESSTDDAVAAGYVLPADAPLIKDAAALVPDF